MKFIRNIFAFIFAIIILFVLGLVLYYIWTISAAVISGAKTLKPEVYVPLVVTLLTASLGLAATLFTQARSRKREVEAAFRERKIEIYLGFMETLQSLFLSAKPELGGTPIDNTELTLKLVEIRTKAVLWGSPGVLKAISQLTKNAEGDAKILFNTVEEIQREMRKDLGLSNIGLDRYFFSKISLTDPNELDKLMSK